MEKISKDHKIYKLFDSEYRKYGCLPSGYWLEVKITNYVGPFDVETHDINGVPDCKVGHFGYNIWVRPTWAAKKPKDIVPPKTIGRLLRTVHNAVAKIGCKVEYFIFSVNDEKYEYGR